MSTRKLTPESMMAKADDACSDARLLLEKGSLDGAVNRAYYAMFAAARSALLASNAPVDLNAIRTHKGLIGAFGEHLVKTGLVPKEMGHVLRQTLKVRMTTDYEGLFVDPEDALTIVNLAKTFAGSMRAKFMPDGGDDEAA